MILALRHATRSSACRGRRLVIFVDNLSVVLAFTKAWWDLYFSATASFVTAKAASLCFFAHSVALGVRPAPARLVSRHPCSERAGKAVRSSKGADAAPAMRDERVWSKRRSADRGGCTAHSSCTAASQRPLGAGGDLSGREARGAAARGAAARVLRVSLGAPRASSSSCTCNDIPR